MAWAGVVHTTLLVARRLVGTPRTTCNPAVLVTCLVGLEQHFWRQPSSSRGSPGSVGGGLHGRARHRSLGSGVRLWVRGVRGPRQARRLVWNALPRPKTPFNEWGAGHLNAGVAVASEHCRACGTSVLAGRRPPTATRSTSLAAGRKLPNATEPEVPFFPRWSGQGSGLSGPRYVATQETRCPQLATFRSSDGSRPSRAGGDGVKSFAIVAGHHSHQRWEGWECDCWRFKGPVKWSAAG